MGNEFTVVGESQANDQWLLVVGTDDEYYGYHPRRNRLVRVKLDEHWVRFRNTEEASEKRAETKGQGSRP
jgi:hypothetical protein